MYNIAKIIFKYFTNNLTFGHVSFLPLFFSYAYEIIKSLRRGDKTG